MSRVFLFGAGASHSYGESPTGVRPPVAKGFFEAFRSLEIAADRHVLIGRIVNYVKDTRGVHPLEFMEWTENIEVFLTEIDERMAPPERLAALPLEERGDLSSTYTEMIFLFASVLNEIQNGPACRNYSRLANSLQPGDVLVTFNWDCLLDRALWETGVWHPSTGYGLEFSGLFDNGWTRSDTSYPSAHRLLKLHGSTNWLMPYLTRDLRTGERRFGNPALHPGMSLMYCFVRSDDTYSTYQGRSRSGYQPFSYYYYPPNLPIDPSSCTATHRGRTQIAVVFAPDLPDHGEVKIGGHPEVSMPLIVPPVRRKHYALLGGALDPLWDDAEAALSECDALTIIGYSFPETDVRSWALVCRACARRTAPLPVTIVDPCPEDLAARLRSRLGAAGRLEVRRCRFDEYMDSAEDQTQAMRQ